MYKTKLISVKNLFLDLNNFRALPQENELDEIRALYYAAPDWYEGLLLSIAQNGYSSLESIGVLRKNKKNLVLEGNRRVSIFKILLGIIPYKKLNIKMSSRVQDAIGSISSTWIEENNKIPCIVFQNDEEPILRQIVRRTHGLDDKAARCPWESISKARESRDNQHIENPELDLLENILRRGEYHSDEEQKIWMANFKYYLFYEIIINIASILQITVRDIRDRYQVSDLPQNVVFFLESLVPQIGRGELKFQDIRGKNKDSYYTSLNLQPLPATPGSYMLKKEDNNREHRSDEQIYKDHNDSKEKIGTNNGQEYPNGKRKKELTPGTERHCHRLVSSLRFDSFPNCQEKLILIRKEMEKLNTEKTPNAYAILFRMILDLAFSEYVNNNKIECKDKLIDKIKKTYEHVLNTATNRTDKERELNKAYSGLVDQNSCISTAVLNVIAHRKKAVAIPADMRLGIYNVVPLLKEIGM